tara:strand:- start:19790 stop:20167 length:378 start_codon:yes stop_codon:yes gene_type:complete
MIISKLTKKLNALNDNKLLLGIAMILFNMGSKYLVMDLSKNQEQFLKSTIVRRMTLFSIFFIATHDLITALILTSSFVILAQGLFNQESKLYILPSYYDTEYTKDEYDMSKKIIKGYEDAHNKSK